MVMMMVMVTDYRGLGGGREEMTGGQGQHGLRRWVG